MRVILTHEIIHNPPPEEVDTVTVFAEVEGYNSSYTGSSSVDEFLDRWIVCDNKLHLEYFLSESGIDIEDTITALENITVWVEEITTYPTPIYSRESALKVYMNLRHSPQIEEAIPVSFDQTSNLGFKAASKLVVKSLPRKIYEKISSTGETCTICLEEFINGGRLVTLPCGHEFDDECAVKWFESSHYCPLCRHMLPCEDQ